MCGIALALEARTAAAQPSISTQEPSFSSQLDEEIQRKLLLRGPDHIERVQRCMGSPPTQSFTSGWTLTLHSSVLHLRGARLFPQPVVDDLGNVLCWNGEIFGTYDGDTQGSAATVNSELMHDNDTKFLSEALHRIARRQEEEIKNQQQKQQILDVFQQIHGPFAFVWLHAEKERVYFGHDHFGRRSLLYHIDGAQKKDLLQELASAACSAPSVATFTQEELARLCISSVALTSNDDCTDSVEVMTFDDVPASGMYVLDLQPINGLYRMEFHPYKAVIKTSAQDMGTKSAEMTKSSAPQDEYTCNLPLTSITASSSELDVAANRLLVALSNAVGVRVRTIPSNKSGNHTARVGVLFSGGLDSVVIAALTHFHVPDNDDHEPIDLLNVCFDSSSNFQSPDRLAAEISYRELQQLFPTRKWNFVRINVPFEDVLAQQQEVYKLMTPCDTHMDFNIGAAFWFLARGQGTVTDESIASSAQNITLGDLNAFLRPSDSTLAVQALERAIAVLHLFDRNNNTVTTTTNGDIICPVIACKRKKKAGCLYGICRVCCFRVQKLVQKQLLHDTDGREKVKCKEKLIEMMGGSREEDVVDSLLEVLTSHSATQSEYLDAAATDGNTISHSCRVHRSKTPTSTAIMPSTSGEADDYPSSASSSSLPPSSLLSKSYTSTARVLLVGIGADEQLAGYGRHRTTYRNRGAQALREELAMDMARIWKRNLGRDDRCISAHGKEARFPFLDEHVVAFLSNIPVDCLCDLSQERGQGDKVVLRAVARQLGLKSCAGLAKRAIQFGTRIAKHSNGVSFGSNRQASGVAKFQIIRRVDNE